MVILSTNKKNTKKIGKKLFPRKKSWKKMFGESYMFIKMFPEENFLYPPPEKLWSFPKYGKRPLLVKVSMKHALWLVETVFFIIERIHREEAHQCVWFHFQYFFGFIQNSNFESYVSEKKAKNNELPVCNRENSPRLDWNNDKK